MQPPTDTTIPDASETVADLAFDAAESGKQKTGMAMVVELDLIEDEIQDALVANNLADLRVPLSMVAKAKANTLRWCLGLPERRYGED